MKHKEFSEEYLLRNETGRYLYHTYAEDLPIVDYHCHLEIREIWENREFEDLGEMWLAHDHYKWRAMRIMGVEETYITGEAGYHEKFLKFAEILPGLAGNPIYLWCALELKRYFDLDQPLGPDNAQEIYRLTRERIRRDHITPRWCMERSKVELVCTTEDPADDLSYHKRLEKEGTFRTRVLTAFRPDKAFYCGAEEFPGYMERLGKAVGQKVESFGEMLEALEARLAYFADFGATVSDNGIAFLFWQPYDRAEAERVFLKSLDGKPLSETETGVYQSVFLVELARLYRRYGFVMQLHVGTYLDANRPKVEQIGKATGFDCMDDGATVRAVGELLNALSAMDALPKTILYPLNPAQMEAFAVLAGGFCDGSARGKVQLGAPWWFNDQPYGIRRQFESAGSLYPVSALVGMLTDSRSFISYPRHEVYRRELCSYLGELIERGEYFSDERYVKELIEDVCLGNVKRFFGWQKEEKR